MAQDTFFFLITKSYCDHRLRFHSIKTTEAQWTRATEKLSLSAQIQQKTFGGVYAAIKHVGHESLLSLTNLRCTFDPKWKCPNEAQKSEDFPAQSFKLDRRPQVGILCHTPSVDIFTHTLFCCQRLRKEMAVLASYKLHTDDDTGK